MAGLATCPSNHISLLFKWRRLFPSQDDKIESLQEISAEYVQTGYWDRPLTAIDERAKEVLVVAEKN